MLNPHGRAAGTSRQRTCFGNLFLELQPLLECLVVVTKEIRHVPSTHLEHKKRLGVSSPHLTEVEATGPTFQGNLRVLTRTNDVRASFKDVPLPFHRKIDGRTEIDRAKNTAQEVITLLDPVRRSSHKGNGLDLTNLYEQGSTSFMSSGKGNLAKNIVLCQSRRGK